MSPEQPATPQVADLRAREAEADKVADALIAIQGAEIGDVEIGWRIVADARGAHTVIVLRVGEQRRWALDVGQAQLLSACLAAEDEDEAGLWPMYANHLRDARREAARRLGQIPDDELRGPIRA